MLAVSCGVLSDVLDQDFAGVGNVVVVAAVAASPPADQRHPSSEAELRVGDIQHGTHEEVGETTDDLFRPKWNSQSYT